MGLQLGRSLGRLYKQGVGDVDCRHIFLVAVVAHPTLAPIVPRGPSSPEAHRFLPVRVDTSEVLHLEHKETTRG